MSLFPVVSGKDNAQPQSNNAISDHPTEWLSNNASYQPNNVLETHQAYGRYATQADFLRAAERYLESSSDSDADVGGGPTARATDAIRHGGTSGCVTIPSQDGKANTRVSTRLDQGQLHRSRSARHGPSTNTDSDHDRQRGDRKKRKHKRRSSQSPSRSKRTHKREGKDGKEAQEKSKKRRKRSHRHRSSSSSSRSSTYEGNSDSRSDSASDDERAKILRLERAAAAAGLAPRQAATIIAGKPILKGAALQPGYYDTRGDLDNLLYECLHGSNVASYHRVDPLGLAKGARAYRLLPGQVVSAGPSRGDGNEDDEWTRGSLLASRYFGARSVAAERSRRLRRVFLSEASVLPGASCSQWGRKAAVARSSGRGSETAAGAIPYSGSCGTVRQGWLLSQLEGPTARGRPSAAETCSGGGSSGVKLAMPMPAYLPLQEPVMSAVTFGGGGGMSQEQRQLAEMQGAAAAVAAGESAEEWVLRRTREFNTALREAPQDVKLWLRFAGFQDTVARLLARRGVEVTGSAAEKKLAILQRALEAHPGHPALLRAMMAASEHLVEPEELLDRWERLLRRFPGEPSLWRDYLARRRGAFASVKLSGLQAAYCNALHALASKRAHQQRQVASAPAAERSTAQASVSALDRELVRLLLELVELELSAGASEMAVARIQALVEFHCFAPGSLDRGASASASGGSSGYPRLPAGAQLRLFDNFWEGGAPRAGEDGAMGWAKWYRKENDALWVAKTEANAGTGGRKGAGQQRQSDDTDPRDSGGGWTGWMELPTPLPPPAALEQEASGAAVAPATGGRDGPEREVEADEGDEEEAAAEEGEGVQLTEEELLAQLGLKLDEQLEEMQRQGVPPDILSRWLRTERERSARNWEPLRTQSHSAGSPSSPSSHHHGPTKQGEGGDLGAADVHRVVLLEDIRDGIFPIEDSGVKLDLILGCLCLLGVPLAAAGIGDAMGASMLLSSCVGCCSQSFLRLLPQQAMIAACQAWLPQGLASAAAAAAAAAAGGRVGGDGGGGPTRWYLQDESRRAFVARLLRGILVDGPYGDEPQLCLAYLLVEASKALDIDADTFNSGGVRGGAAPLLQCVDRAREAARGLLSARRTSLAMVMALAALEDAAGQPRAARRARDAALAGASALPLDEQRMLPLLVHQYAEAERGAAMTRARTGSSSVASGLTALFRAHDVLRWFLASWLPVHGAAGSATSQLYAPYKSGQQVTREDVTAARRGFEARIPSLLSTREGILDAPSASCLYLGGLFEALTARLFPAAAGGLVAALTIHKHATAAVPAAVRQSSGYHEALAVSYCGLVVSELNDAAEAAGARGCAGVEVPPARARMALLQALELYPNNPQLLGLRLRLGYLAGGGAQCRLRRDLMAMAVALRRRAEVSCEALAVAEEEKAEEPEAAGGGGAQPQGLSNSASAAAAVWWAQVATEATQTQGDAPVNRLMERAAAVRHLAGCPTVWTAYLAHEAGTGRYVQVKRVFLRAVREVPLSKDMWMVGLSLLGQGPVGGGSASLAGGFGAGGSGGSGANHVSLTSREVSELMGVALDKGVRMRTDVYEVMLQHLADEQES